MTSKLVVNTIEADTGISSVSFASSISMNSTAKFHFSAAGIDIGADTNINRPAAGVLGFNVNGAEKVRIDTNGHIHGVGVVTATHFYGNGSNLTGITGTTINNNADNRLITGSGTANTLNGEATLTYNSGTMFLSNSGGDAYLKLSRNASVSDGTAIGTIDFCNNTGNTTNARVAAYASGGSNVGGHLYFETRDPSNSTLSERVRISSVGQTLINTSAVTNTHDYFTVKRPASGFGEMSMTVDANTSTGSAANAFIFTKSKHTYWNGYGFQSSHGHIGAIVGKRDSGGGDSDQEIRIEIGGTHINQSEERTWNFKNNGDLSISNGDLKLASGRGINFHGYATSGNPSSNLLDDYEEGSWNPEVLNGWGILSPTYSEQDGKYIKIGRLVYVIFRLKLNGGSTNGNRIAISNFPFSAVTIGNSGYANGGYAALNGYCDSASSNAQSVFCMVGRSTTTAELFHRENTGESSFTGTELSNSGSINFSGCYMTP